jgi:hypothetical protein
LNWLPTAIAEVYLTDNPHAYIPAKLTRAVGRILMEKSGKYSASTLKDKKKFKKDYGRVYNTFKRNGVIAEARRIAARYVIVALFLAYNTFHFNETFFRKIS